MEQKRILIVEDSPYLAESLVDMLEIRGHQTLVAKNGREAIALALAERPDLIILDIRLPDIDGYTVYRTVRADEDWGKTANIVVLTASESVEMISKNIDLPNERVLFKPQWSVPDLMNRLESLLT